MYANGCYGECIEGHIKVDIAYNKTVRGTILKTYKF